MRIAQLTYLYEPSIGGVENHVKNLSEMLVRQGHSVDVITSDFSDLAGKTTIPLKREIINGVNVFRLTGKVPQGKHFLAQNIVFNPVTEILISGNYDVVHCHSIPSDHFTQAYSYCQKYQKKLFVTPHFSPDDLERTFQTRLTPWFWRLKLIPKLKKVDRIFAVSPSEKNIFCNLTKIPSGKFEVVPNAVNLSEIDSVTESEITQFKNRFQISKPLLLYVGRIVRTKGVDILLKAIQRLSTIDFEVMIIGPIGDQEYYQELQVFIQEHQLARMVRIVQLPRRDVVKAFHVCDIFVLPTRGEVFGIVLAEAMACRKIVIGTDAGGIPDLIQPNKNGLLFGLEDSDDLASLIQQIIANPEQYQYLRHQARLTVEQKYNWETNAQKIATIYQQ